MKRRTMQLPILKGREVPPVLSLIKIKSSPVNEPKPAECLNREGLMLLKEARAEIKANKKIKALVLMIQVLSKTCGSLPSDKVLKRNASSGYSEANNYLNQALKDLESFLKLAFDEDILNIPDDKLNIALEVLGITNKEEAGSVIKILKERNAGVGTKFVTSTISLQDYTFQGIKLVDLKAKIEDRINNPQASHGVSVGDNNGKPKKQEDNYPTFVKVQLNVSTLPKTSLPNLSNLQNLQVSFPDFKILNIDGPNLPSADELATALRRKTNDLSENQLESLIDSIISFQEGTVTILISADNSFAQLYRIPVSEFEEKIEPLLDKPEDPTDESSVNFNPLETDSEEDSTKILTSDRQMFKEAKRTSGRHRNGH